MNGADGAIREPAVAGSFYPERAESLHQLVDALLAGAVPPPADSRSIGSLVPHAGLIYSGAVAASGWRALLAGAGRSPTIVILGTNHSARFEGVAVYEAGAWRTPVGNAPVDNDVAARILALGEPFVANRQAHRDEHSIEVQLPVLLAVRPEAHVVPCSVSAGTGREAVAAGGRLGTLLADLRAHGREVLLAISTDMAHYPAHDEAERVTARLAPSIMALDAATLAVLERAETDSGAVGMVCGMCGIQPTMLGLAALRAMGAAGGTVIAAATSADVGADPHRTVGYLAVGFT